MILKKTMEPKMLIKTLLNQVQKFKSFVYSDVYLSKNKGQDAIEIRVSPRKNAKPICSGCHQTASLYGKLDERLFEFIPIWGFPVFLRYQMRRVNCKTCGVLVEQLPWADGKRQLTKTYMQFLARWAKKMSWQEVANTFNTSWKKVFYSIEYMVHWGLEHRDLSEVTAIGVDEIAIHEGHKYLTMVYQIDKHCSRLLWAGKDRTTKTLLYFFRMFGKEASIKLRFVCSDMWKPYLKVIKKKAPHAIHVLDRFHIMKMFGKAIDQVRAEEQKQMKKDGYEEVLKNSRWCLLKRKENLTVNQEAKLKDLLKYNLKSLRAYLLKEDFNGFWEYVSPSWAGKFLDRWCTRTMRSKIEPMKKVVKTIRRHKTLILNWFVAKKAYSSGIVEGFNNKAKVTTRKSYGFRTDKCAIIALYHVLGGLPEPPMLHSF
jgi:transposase